MSVIFVKCPRCGHGFFVEVRRSARKGEGAHYAYRIKRLTQTHLAILRVLKERGPLPKRRLVGILNDMGIRISGNALSGRLSELNGLGYVRMFYGRIKLLDKRTMQFRYRKVPFWEITPEGLRALENY